MGVTINISLDSYKVLCLFQVNLNFKSVNIEGAELHNMGQQTDLGNLYGGSLLSAHVLLNLLN